MRVGLRELGGSLRRYWAILEIGWANGDDDNFRGVMRRGRHGAYLVAGSRLGLCRIFPIRYRRERRTVAG